jgi:hypothetical protein
MRLHYWLCARLLCHDLLVKQTKTALNQFFQPLDSVTFTCSGCLALLRLVSSQGEGVGCTPGEWTVPLLRE